jgi:protein-disulfide isomerase
MASRKEQKEQARAARLQAEQAAAADRARRQRLQLIGGVIVIAIVVIGVAIGISVGGSSPKKINPHSAASKATYNQVNALLSGIPQHGTTLGNPNAKISMTFFGDLECPVCKAFDTGEGGGGLPQFIAHQVKAGTVKVTYRSLCTATCNDYSNGQSIFNNQQVAAYAAGKQNLFWDYEELFYHEQQQEGTNYVNASWLDGLAQQIPTLNYSKWQSDLHDGSLLSQVQADAAAAQKDGFTGTPSVVMSGPKGSEQVAPNSVPTYAQLTAAVSAVS